nr:DUF4340 domain-containing protein [uncultured Blautia sp.]
MKKKSVNLITAVGVLVVLSGAYAGVKAYVANQDAAEAEKEEEENPEILSIASDDVKSIKFVIDKKEVTFEKDGDSWIKSDETDFPLDQDKVEALISSLNSVTAERTLENVENAAEYELDQPENTITVTTQDGETTVIQLGMENSSTSQEYIDLNDDSSTVYVVSNSVFSSFEGTLYDFAKSGTFPTVDSSTVRMISVDGKDSSYVVEKDENNLWSITGGGDTEKADSAKTTSLASSLSSMAYDSFVNYNCSEDQLSQYGLDKPYGKITVDYQEEVEEDTDTDEIENVEDSESTGDANNEDETDATENVEDVTEAESAETVENAEDATEAESTENGEITENDNEDSEPEMVDRELVIQIGNQSSDGGRYVRVNDSNEIYTISEESLNTFFDKTNADFWDMTVSYLSVNNLDTLDVNYKDEEYIVNVSRETFESDAESTDETEDVSDSETAETTNDDSSVDSGTTVSNDVALAYALNGNDLDSTAFTTFYNKLINMVAQKRLTDKFESNEAPEMTVKFTDVDGNEMDVDYYTYDTNYYAAVVGEKVYLVNKMTVKELFQSFDKVVGGELEENVEE